MTFWPRYLACLLLRHPYRLGTCGVTTLVCARCRLVWDWKQYP